MKNHKRKSPRTLSATDRVDVIRMHKEGLSLREIASILVVSSSQIAKIVNMAVKGKKDLATLQRKVESDAKRAVGHVDHAQVVLWRDRFHAAEFAIAQLRVELDRCEKDLERERSRANEAWVEAANRLRPRRRVLVSATKDEIDGEVRIVVFMHHENNGAPSRNCEHSLQRSLPLGDGQYVADLIRTWLFPEKEAKLDPMLEPEIEPTDLDDEDDDL